ncbi:DUF2000 domain-containing protein [Neisseriaceae bacterium JH1-16]|nr:DUF2000 domain-containing protein [Neisseriaceae bacterium JH1-16]
MSNPKCVIVLDQALPPGAAANTAAVLALSLGRAHPALIGADLHDQAGQPHLGITTAAIPILKNDTAALRTLRAALREHEPALTVVDLSSATRRTRSYAEYAADLAATPAEAIDYQGIALCGDAQLVTRYTGSHSLWR